MKVEIREYQKQDFKALENIVRETWNYDKFSSPKTASNLARVFLSSCLADQTFSRVAVLDNTPVGVILGKNIAVHRCPLKYRLNQIRAVISLYISKEGRKVSKIFGNVDRIDEQLLNECGKEYPAELILFAVSHSCRGKGIGKILFQSVLDYFKEHNLDEFYLFTDTSCDYGFYEHQKMIRRHEKKHIFQIGEQTATIKFFIYEHLCNDKENV